MSVGGGFGDNLRCEYRRVPFIYITMTRMLSGMGSSGTSIWIMLAHFKAKVHPDTITRILEHYSGMAEGYASAIKPPYLGRSGAATRNTRRSSARSRGLSP